MNRLPTEIIINPPTNWSLADKLNLASTCKQLYNIISENTLYSKLVFRNRDAFDKARELHNEKNIGQQVRNLVIENMEYVSALPTLFPRVQFLNLRSGSDGSDSQTAIVDTNNLQVTATNWRHVECIKDHSKFMNVTIPLLPHLTFEQLRSLEINCGATYIPNTTQRQERTQALIQTIHNAPLLERLVFRYPILKIADMETLHAGATRLKNVEFLDPDIYAGNAENQVSHYHPTAVESFIIQNSAGSLELLHDERTDEVNQTLADAIRKWISYIGLKYPQLVILCLKTMINYQEDLSVEDKDSITTCLATAIANMKCRRSPFSFLSTA